MWACTTLCGPHTQLLQRLTLHDKGSLQHTEKKKIGRYYPIQTKQSDNPASRDSRSEFLWSPLLSAWIAGRQQFALTDRVTTCAVIVLVGNKADLEGQRAVSHSSAQSYADACVTALAFNPLPTYAAIVLLLDWLSSEPCTVQSAARAASCKPW